jgi:hypothetical protein
MSEHPSFSAKNPKPLNFCDEKMTSGILFDSLLFSRQERVHKPFSVRDFSIRCVRGRLTRDKSFFSECWLPSYFLSLDLQERWTTPSSSLRTSPAFLVMSVKGNGFGHSLCVVSVILHPFSCLGSSLECLRFFSLSSLKVFHSFESFTPQPLRGSMHSSESWIEERH